MVDSLLIYFFVQILMNAPLAPTTVHMDTPAITSREPSNVSPLTALTTTRRCQTSGYCFSHLQSTLDSLNVTFFIHDHQAESLQSSLSLDKWNKVSDGYFAAFSAF